MKTAERQWTAQQIAALVKGEVVGDPEALITGLASIEDARQGDLVFAENERYRTAALRSGATALLAHPEIQTNPPIEKALILVSDPRTAFVTVLEAFAPPLSIASGIHPTAQLGEGVQLGEDVCISANVTVGNAVTLGARVKIFPGVVIGDGCQIGDDTVLYANVVLYPHISIGKRCILHSGCVIGADGFGYIPVGHALRKVPQLGTVEIGDDVEIGANSCVDRAKTGVTVIGSGTKLDNLVHIAHNVRLGYSCILVAQVGIAGSTTVGNGVIFAGQSGAADHLTIGDGVRATATAAVVTNIAAGETVTGFPARPHAQKLREFAALSALPDYIKRIRALEKRLAELEKKAEE